MLDKIKSFFINLLMIVFFAFAICMTILLLNYNDYGLTQFGSTTMVIINDEIASENYKKGDLVLVKSVKIDDFEEGDEVFVYRISGKGEVSVELGNIGDIYLEEDSISFENGDTFSMEFVIGSTDKVYEDIGMILSIIESKWGFLFIILVPCFLLFIYEIYALIVEIKYGEDE